MTTTSLVISFQLQTLLQLCELVDVVFDLHAIIQQVVIVYMMYFIILYLSFYLSLLLFHLLSYNWNVFLHHAPH